MTQCENSVSTQQGFDRVRALDLAPTSFVQAMKRADAATATDRAGKTAARCAGWTRSLSLAVAGVFLLALASKLFLVHFAASQVPFYDEWDGEAAAVIKPFLEGHFSVADLFQHDNEHLIFFTRLLTILDLKISGYWDVLPLMIFNAFLHATTLALGLWTLTRPLAGPRAMAALLFGCGLAVIPFGHESALMGFNTHFYTLIAFSLAALWLLADARAWSGRWFCGVLMAAGAYLSMASGALAPATAAGLALVQFWRGARSGLAEALAIVALLIMSALFVALTPSVPENAAFHAHSLSSFLFGLLDLLAWPVRVKFGAVLYLPGLAFALALLRDAPRRADPRWFNLGVLAWVLVQMAALSFGRNGSLYSRYLDFCVVGLFANIVSALWLAPRLDGFLNRRRFVALALATSAILAALAGANHGRVMKIHAITERRDDSRIQEARLRAYLATGGSAALIGKGRFDIPYPSADRLKAFLDDPTIRATLPPDLNPTQRVHPLVEGIKSSLLSFWGLFLLAGLAAWGAAVLRLPSPDRGMSGNGARGSFRIF
ncbi:hypothetical protein [Rhodoblastus sp.]|uniref:hypothetical protein n=1 Tax=Rhodoblastus sp. TaxID=1962975 RepID=UPI002634C618|nr:hypothetical protein [Rhodoblastus sp.]